MNTLIFGSKSSPSSAIFVKNTNADEFKDSMPEAASAIINDSYVDDFLKSVETENEAVTMINQVSFINEQGGFNMHSWACNSSEVLTSIPIDQRDSNDVSLNIDKIELKQQKALGLFWRTKEDLFLFNVGLTKIPSDILHGERRPTKREFLRTIMSVFDPLGFLAPFVIRSKILMQEVWISGIGWDEPLGDNEYESWKSWIKELPNVGLCSVPRCYLLSNERRISTQLHIFCDSSSKEYSTVAYLRFLLDDGLSIQAL